MTAMINQEALAKARDAWRDAIIAAVVENMVGGTDDFPSLNMAGFIGTLSELTPFNIEAIPHVDRAGVLEEAAKVADAEHQSRAADQRGIKPSSAGPLGELCLAIGGAASAKAIASSIRALAQPAVNTSPEGVGGTRSEPVEVEPTDPYAELVAFFNEPAAYAKWGLQGDYDGLRPVETAVRALRDVLAR